jgi:hypothetical protein
MNSVVLLVAVASLIGLVLVVARAILLEMREQTLALRRLVDSLGLVAQGRSYERLTEVVDFLGKRIDDYIEHEHHMVK